MIQPAGSIAQIAYVVDDLEQAMSKWLNSKMTGPFFVIEQVVFHEPVYRGNAGEIDLDIALGYTGNMCVELIRQKCDRPSVYQELMQRQGGGFHHWGVIAKDYEKEMADYEQKGIELAFDSSIDGTRFAYYDTVAELGGMIELFEPTKPFLELFEFLAGTAENWDGKDPIRSFS